MTIGSLDNRVGEMVRKASEKAGYGFETLPSALHAGRWGDFVFALWTPDKEGRIVARGAVQSARDHGKMWYQIMPDMYPEAADAIQTYLELLFKHVEFEGDE